MKRPTKFRPPKELLDERAALLLRAKSTREEYLREVEQGGELLSSALEHLKRAAEIHQEFYDDLERFREGFQKHVGEHLEENEDRISKRQYDKLNEHFNDWDEPLEFRDVLPDVSAVDVEDFEEAFDDMMEQFNDLPMEMPSS